MDGLSRTSFVGAGKYGVKRPLPATRCRCHQPVIDGDDECIMCGHLVVLPDLTAPIPIESVCSHELGGSRVLPNVIHSVRLAA